MVYKPNVLIISNLLDYSTDHVVYQLEKHNIAYLRLNRDQFSEYEITIDPIKNIIYGKTNEFDFKISETELKSIYYRAPIYLRPHQRKHLSIEEKISREQWISFLRSLMIFDNVYWINHPQHTFLSENKPYQLKIGKNVGFNIPKTIITNKIPNAKFNNQVAIKTLEPIIFEIDKKESFIYTNILNSNDLKNYDLSNTPLIIQEALIPKIDIRVTITPNTIYAVSITRNNSGIDEDWRTKKDYLEYNLIKLPEHVEKNCFRLLKKLKLEFGCIDLIKKNETYYFIEINPTGEWDWLMYNLNLNIDEDIANLLIKRGKINV